MVKVDRTNVETLLDAGLLYAEMNNGRWWRVRRNGATKTWKRAPERFQIPIKSGMRAYGYVDEDCVGNFRHADDVPGKK